MGAINLQEASKALISRMDCAIRSGREQFMEKFTEHFCAYCDQIYQMQQEGTKGAIAYLHFSVLRTNILLRRHEVRMDAYDESWYMDTAECSAYYPVEEIYSYLEEYMDLVEALQKEAHGGISLAEAQKRIFVESRHHLFYLAQLIRFAMQRAILTEEYKRVKRAPVFVVCIGGFMDRFDILYKEDQTKKDSARIKRNLKSKRQTLFSYEIYRGLDLSDGDFAGIEFQYSVFDESDLTGSCWRRASLLFSSCRETVFREADMEQIRIFDTDFSGAVFERVNFTGAKLKHVSFTGASLHGLDFSKALLMEEIDFTGARIEECILPEGAKGWSIL